MCLIFICSKYNNVIAPNVSAVLKDKLRYEHQYSETNVMHFLFNLLRIKGFYMFRALLAHPQEGSQTALGIFRACYVSWHEIYQAPFVSAS
jgi:hypothetical protein